MAAALSGLPWASASAAKTKAAREQLKNPATRAGLSSINSVAEARIAAADQYFATTGADGAKLNR